MITPIPEEVYATFAGTIDDMAAQRVFNSMSIAINGGAKRVHILMQSHGGFIGSGIAIYNFLRNLPIEVITYNGGQISSTAVIAFLGGKNRRTSENSTFMIHKGTFSLPSPIGIESMQSKVDALYLDNENTESILRKHIIMPDEKWGIHNKSDLTLSSSSALEYKLVHEISCFKLPQRAQLYNI